MERERIKYNYIATEKLVNLIGKGIKGLDATEYKILSMFYMDGKYSVMRMVEELGYEQSQIYRMKDRALYKFTIEMYGITDY